LGFKHSTAIVLPMERSAAYERKTWFVSVEMLISLVTIDSHLKAVPCGLPHHRQRVPYQPSSVCRRAHARLPTIAALIVGLLLAVAGNLFQPDVVHTSRDRVQPLTSAVPRSRARLNEPFIPLPAVITLDSELVKLGGKLFHDPQLSADGTVACASCHHLNKGGDDDRPHSIGVNGKEGDINAPTVLNSSLNFRQFWNGRANTLEDQIDGPISNPNEMASEWKHIVDYLRNNENYRQDFANTFGRAPSVDLVKSAIATFERSLITPSRFDRWLRGDDSALSTDELKGYELFKQYRCDSCHSGDNVGGNMFQRLGAMEQYFGGGRKLRPSDYGRFTVTGKEYDRFVFRVPSLRNVADTAPYFHDGSVRTLSQAVRIMIKYQLGREVVPADVELIAAFLGSLSREADAQIMSQAN
jgi:cytochrome c peroxidase